LASRISACAPRARRRSRAARGPWSPSRARELARGRLGAAGRCRCTVRAARRPWREQSRRARSSRGGRLPRSRAAAPRAPARTSGPSPRAARRPSSCRSPCRSARRRRATSTASPASNAPATSTIPTGSSDVPPSRSARAAPASTDSVPCDGLAYLSQSLSSTGARVRREPRARGLARPGAREHAGLDRADHGRDAGGVAISGRDDLRAHPPEADGETARCQRGQLRVATSRRAPRRSARDRR
jgi:hypothetical protein